MGLIRDLDRNLGFLFTAFLAVLVFILGSLVCALSAQAGPLLRVVEHRRAALGAEGRPMLFPRFLTGTRGAGSCGAAVVVASPCAPAVPMPVIPPVVPVK
jgi:hypothetical protein